MSFALCCLVFFLILLLSLRFLYEQIDVYLYVCVWWLIYFFAFVLYTQQNLLFHFQRLWRWNGVYLLLLLLHMCINEWNFFYSRRRLDIELIHSEILFITYVWLNRDRRRWMAFIMTQRIYTRSILLARTYTRAHSTRVCV